MKQPDKATEARRRSREQIGTVPRTKLIPDKRRKPVKHPKREQEQQ